MTARPQVELPRVEKYVPTSSHGGMVAVVSNDYSHTYVKFNDYAALTTRLAESEARAVADARRLDWLSKRMRMIDLWNLVYPHMPETPADVRAAIDAAQEAEREAASA